MKISGGTLLKNQSSCGQTFSAQGPHRLLKIDRQAGPAPNAYLSNNNEKSIAVFIIYDCLITTSQHVSLLPADSSALFLVFISANTSTVLLDIQLQHCFTVKCSTQINKIQQIVCYDENQPDPPCFSRVATASSAAGRIDQAGSQ